jgi:photosystem II stability/assembly factor-like uncharacterized protein
MIKTSLITSCDNTEFMGNCPSKQNPKSKQNTWLPMWVVMMVSFLLTGLLPSAVEAQTYQWKNVQINGGGYVTGIIYSPTEQNLVYARTDVGGAYRWDATNKVWIPLSDSFGSSNDYGVISLATDPSDPDRVYMATGLYTPSWGETGAVYSSTNRGDTWTRNDLSIKFGGNEGGRAAGERLQVDPNLGSILFLGSSTDGLWKSTDYGSTWNKVSSFPVSTTPSGSGGISFVLFDKSSGSAGNATSTIYVGVLQTDTTNLFKSTDGGANWTAIPDQPTTMMPRMAALASNGMIYLSYSDTNGPNNVQDGAVWKLNPSDNSWTDVSPPDGQGGFGGISVDAQNPNHLIAGTMGRWWPGDAVFSTTDGGANWTNLLTDATWDHSLAPYAEASNPHWIGDVDIDPFNSDNGWFVTGYGLYNSNNLTDSTTHWIFQNKGLEEMAATELISPPSGAPLLSAIGDQDGFKHDNLDVSPAAGRSTLYGTNISIDFAQDLPSVMVRTYNNDSGNYGSYSTDGGDTWTALSSIPSGTTGGGNIAISADGNRIVWAPQGASGFYYSTDQGSSWTASSGSVPAELKPVSDRVNSQKFYVYDAENGKVWVSTDGGASFSAQASDLPTFPGYQLWLTRIRTVFGVEGDIWLANLNGLYRSTNSGTSFTKLTNVESAVAVSFGKAAPGETYPAVFIVGTINGTHGFYRSDDTGATWVRINDDQHRYGTVVTVTADPRVYGRFYVAGSGRGIIYGDFACTPSTITPYVQIDGGSWQQTASASATAGGSVMFGPQPATGGSWSWSGPNGFTASTRQVFISNIQANQAGEYVATYTNDGGCQSAQSITVTVCTPTSIIPYVQVNGGTWQQTANDSVTVGGSVMFGPQPNTGGSWSWSGPNGFSASTREVYISNIQFNQAGDYVATYTNSNGCQSIQTFNITVSYATGTILREYWTGISGTTISDLTSDTNYPNSPSGSEQLTSLEGPTNWEDNYGTRIRGYIHPTSTGDYTFWVAGDDNTELYLSTDDNPVNTTRIAYVDSWTNSKEWNTYSTQQSASVSLTAGQRYYIEVLHKEGFGGDNVAVAWQGPGITQQVIDGSYLSPYVLLKSATIENGLSPVVNNITLYPNPSSGGKFTVAIPEIAENVSIRIFNMQGKFLYIKDTEGLEQIKCEPHLNKGIYLVKVSSDKFDVIKKLIVN